MDEDKFKKHDKIYSIARDFERNGRVDEAIELYERIADEYDETIEPYERLAIIYRKRKLIDEEIRVLKHGIWVFENVVVKGRGDRIPKLKKLFERLNKAEKLNGDPITSYTLPDPLEIVGPVSRKPKKPKVPRINTRTIRGKALYIRSLDSMERQRVISNLQLNTKVSIIRKAVKQECSSLKVGYHKPFGSYGEKYLAIKPSGHNWRYDVSFSDYEKIAIVRLFGDIIGIHNPGMVPMGIVDITNIDAFVQRSVDLIY